MNKVVVITGGHSGLGKSMTLELSAQGATVIMVYNTNQAAAQEVAEFVRKKGGNIQFLQMDVTDWSQVQSGFNALLKEKKRIDVLINNVGDFVSVPLDETGVHDWNRMLNSNLNSVFYCCSAVIPAMRKQRFGRIINIGLANADRIHAYSKVVPYAIAKTGVIILTKSLARQEASHGITVNAISPGLFDNGCLSDNDILEQSAQVPMGKVGTGNDLLGALLFLLSDQARYVTGSNIIVSGGWGL